MQGGSLFKSVKGGGGTTDSSRPKGLRRKRTAGESEKASVKYVLANGLLSGKSGMGDPTGRGNLKRLLGLLII